MSPDRVVFYAWLIAGALAAVAGTMYGIDKSYKPFTYFQLLLPIFASAILGGIGHPIGAVAGGFIVALSETSVTYAYKKFVRYLAPESWEPSGLVQLLSTDYKIAISFVILVVVLRWCARPGCSAGGCCHEAEGPRGPAPARPSSARRRSSPVWRRC